MSALKVFVPLFTTARWHTQHAAWLVRIWLGQGQWMIWVAALVMAACAGFIGLEVLPQRSQLASLQDGIIHTRGVNAAKPESATVTQPGAADAEWLGTLPSVHERTAILEGMVNAAPKHNLYLQQAQYQWVKKPADDTVSAAVPASAGEQFKVDSIVALQWSVPVKGSYRDIREYVGELLETNPSMALDSISINRDGAVGSRLNVDLVFTLYMRARP